MPIVRTGTLIRRRRFEPTPAAADVVQVHRLADGEIGVGVEAAHELVAVIVEVALDLEPLPQREPPVELAATTSRPNRSVNTSSERNVICADLPATARPSWGPLRRSARLEPTRLPGVDADSSLHRIDETRLAAHDLEERSARPGGERQLRALRFHEAERHVDPRAALPERRDVDHGRAMVEARAAEGLR